MATVTTDSQNYEDIADAIREQGVEGTFKPSEMANAIAQIVGGGTTTDIQQAVNDWLEEHPEATTTVQDGSLTLKKFKDDEFSYVTPEQFGAKGDGVTNDTTAIQNAINTNKPIVLGAGKTYIVTSFIGYHGLKLFGNGATFKRPNLKSEPYSMTDAQIKALRLFDYSVNKVGNNTNLKLTEFHDLTIDINCWENDWTNTENAYKYEQGVCFYINENTYRAKFLFDNVHFKNNYTSNISIQNNCDITISNCTSYECFKGICTIVGDGVNVNINNVICDSTYGAETFWYEVNSAALGSFAIININNTIFNGKIQCLSPASGVINISNSYINGKELYFVSKSGSKIHVTNTTLVGTLSDGNEQVIRLRGLGNISFSNCDISGSPLILKHSTANDCGMNLIVDSCVFHDAKACIVCDASTNDPMPTVIVKGCIFKNITDRVFGSAIGENNAGFKKLIISDCLFDVACRIWYNGANGNNYPIFNGGNDVINSDNTGIRIWGAGTIIMKDEIWSVPVPIEKYRSGATYNPIGFGKRTTLVSEAPAFVGINDVDYAKLTLSPYTEYKYTNNAWVEIN